MSAANIFIDEAGYTGEDMLNAEQPVMVVASHSVGQDECEGMIDDVFKGWQGGEIKHSVLRRRPSNQNRVVRLIENLISQQAPATLWIIHKKFVLFQRFVDYFVEPAFYRRGQNFYKNGMNMAFCNMAYHCLEAFEGAEFMDEFLLRFETMMRVRSQKNYSRFWMFLRSKRQEAHESSYRIFDTLLLGDERGVAEYAEIPENALDIAFTMTLNTVCSWRERSKGPFIIVHDSSSNMAKRQDIWDRLTSPDLEEMFLGHGDYRRMIFPLNVLETRFSDSMSSIQLQLADVIAGAMYECCRARSAGESSDYVDKLSEAGIDSFIINGIWPSTDVEPTEPVVGAPEMLDPIDTIARIMYPR